MSGLYEALRENFLESEARAIQNMPRSIYALLKADRNKDGALSAEEQMDAIDAGVFSDEFKKILKAVDCANPKPGLNIGTFAADISSSIKRSVDALRLKQPGFKAQEYADVALAGILKALQPQQQGMLGGKELLTTEEKQSLKDTLKMSLVNADLAAQRVYEAIQNKDKTVTLPTGVSLVTPAVLCKRVSARGI